MPIQPDDWGAPFYAELREITRNQWPNVPDSQYFLVMQANFDNLVQQIRYAMSKDPQGNPPLPYIVVEVGQFDPVDDWGLQNRFKRAKLRISYVIRMTDKASTNQTNQEAVQSDIYLLSETLDATDYIGTDISPKTFRPIENCQIDSSHNMPINAAMVESSVKVWSCSIMYEQGVLVGNLETEGIPQPVPTAMDTVYGGTGRAANA